MRGSLQASQTHLMLLRSMHVSTRMGIECFVTSLAMSPAEDTGRPAAVDPGVGRGSPKPAPGPNGEEACSPNVNETYVIKQ